VFLPVFDTPTMPKITRFADIPPFTRSGEWECSFGLDRLVAWVARQQAESGLNLEPDFQRGHVWTTRQQVRFVEFLLRGGRTGRTLYFNCPWWNQINPTVGEFVIVDGKQRLHAITRFIRGEIRVFGSYFCEFLGSPRVTQTMRVNVNDLPTRADVLQFYLDLNTGGTPHSAGEIARVRRLLKRELDTLRRRGNASA
jgi:hypothetical protein